MRKPHFLLNRFGTKSGVTFSEELRRRQAGFCLFKRGSSFTEKQEVLVSASMYSLESFICYIPKIDFESERNTYVRMK